MGETSIFPAFGNLDGGVKIGQLFVDQILLDDRPCRSDLRVHLTPRESDIQVFVFVSGNDLRLFHIEKIGGQAAGMYPVWPTGALPMRTPVAARSLSKTLRPSSARVPKR